MGSPSYEVLAPGRELDHAFMREANARGSIAARRAHNVGHGARILVFHRLEPGNHAFAVSGVAVLARLPFSPYVEDLDLDADDRPALHRDEIGGRGARPPRRFSALPQR